MTSSGSSHRICVCWWGRTTLSIIGWCWRRAGDLWVRLSGLLGPKAASQTCSSLPTWLGWRKREAQLNTLVDSQPLGQRLYHRFYVTAQVVGGDNPCAFDCPHPCWDSWWRLQSSSKGWKDPGERGSSSCPLSPLNFSDCQWAQLRGWVSKLSQQQKRERGREDSTGLCDCTD